MTDQSIDEILTSIRGIMKKNQQNNLEKDEKMELIELSEAIDEKNEQFYKNKIFSKNNEYKDFDRREKIINLTEKKLNIDIKKKIEDFLLEVNAVNQQKKSDRTLDLENLVTKLLIPYLADWLSSNLSDMVEEILSREIKKIIK